MDTLDKDFGELATSEALPIEASCDWSTSAPPTTASRRLAAIDAHGAVLAQGAIVTVEPGRVRVRPPESSND